MLTIEQDKSNQSSRLTGAKGFPNIFKILYLVSSLEILWSWKLFDFQINDSLLKFATISLFIWSACCLVSAMKKCFFSFYWNNFWYFLWFYALSYGFLVLIQLDFTIFFITLRSLPIFCFLDLSHYHIIDCSHIK